MISNHDIAFIIIFIVVWLMVVWTKFIIKTYKVQIKTSHYDGN